MSNLNRSPVPESSNSPSKILFDNADGDSLERVTFLKQLQKKPGTQNNLRQYNVTRPQTFNQNNSPLSRSPLMSRNPANFLEAKQQRLLAEADRKKRIIARIISIVGLLIILLCAVIVTLTLKMAPKIDELVRTKTGKHNLFYQVSRFHTPFTTSRMILNNSTMNNT